MSIWSSIQGSITFPSANHRFSVKKCAELVFYEEFTVSVQSTAPNCITFQIAICQDGPNAFFAMQEFIDRINEAGGRFVGTTTIAYG